MKPHESTRIAVVGAGVIGTMTAWQLAERGFSVTVFEQWNTPNDRGASAGESRIFRTVYKEGAEYVPLLQKSRDQWDRLQRGARGAQILEMCGGLTIGRPEEPDVAAVIACAESAGLEHRVLDAETMAREYPQFRLDDDEVGVLDPAAGVFRPELAVLAARDAGMRAGAEYRTYARVLNIRPQSFGVMVDTAAGAEAFDTVVLASGPWANELSGLGREVLAPRRLVAGWFPAGDVELHRPARMPISIRRHPEGGFSCFPVLDGMAVKILPHHLPWQDLETVGQLPRFVEPELVQAAERAVARLMPGLDPTAIRISTWTEGFTADGAPVVGPSPEDERILLAVGMSGQGFKFSPMVGSILADYAEHGASADAVSVMDSLRWSRSAAGGERA
ncbi:N-methyl-L-tryptophan oxidase [Brevibacterium album]|uniref:N-methyl-L-tryptophan oxidase n=1 Tax=Brevibacterium album TaxID=417948 RepID=UPI0004235143|nr:N-methyl-L-tryptophan oxidase [Brevibacterium album]